MLHRLLSSNRCATLHFGVDLVAGWLAVITFCDAPSRRLQVCVLCFSLIQAKSFIYLSLLSAPRELFRAVLCPACALRRKVIRRRSVTSIMWSLQDEPSTVDKVKAVAADAADVAAAK